MPLQVSRWGPFHRGVIDGLNSTLDTAGALRWARNAFMDGVGRIQARPGTELAMTLKDDQGTPANVTSVVCLVAFGDGALAVGHSTIQDKFYLYRFNSELSGWYNAGGALQSNLNAEPVAVLWTTAPDSDRVLIAEGLGEAFIAHTNAGSSFRSKRYSVASGLANLDADLNGGGVAQTFFRGLVSFQQHLWGWGYGSETAGENDRPELLRFGLPIFGTSGGGYFAQTDSLTVGHKVRSFREKVISAVVAGEVLYVGTNFSLWPVTGFGRNSWDKSRPLDDSYGFASILGAVSANGILHYWSHRGPLRVAGLSRPEPLWDAVPEALAAVVNPANVIATFDPDRDQVIFLYQSQTSTRVSVLGAIDTRRNAWLGPDGDVGLGVACAGLVTPTTSSGPTAPPTGASTTGVGNTVGTGNLTPGDVTAGCRTIWQYKRQVDSVWISAADTPSTQAAFQFTGLAIETPYHWRAYHLKNGQSSAILGPSASTQFTTTNVLQPPTNCQVSQPLSSTLLVSWQNSGESGTSTEIYIDDGVNPPTTYRATAGEGLASYAYRPGAGVKTMYAQVRHGKPGFNFSAFSNVASGTFEFTDEDT